jgi:diaminohydroxyphosphoribosylaminopyrimidine deaminase/5-amino-6-(5-phosphoribosylamino)uracil reductase
MKFRLEPDIESNTEAENDLLITDMIEGDAVFMKRAIELAARGAGLVSPNPMVGALLIKNGRVIGEGFHRYDLLKHGEIYAIEMAGEEARGATLYCNLEPCCHHGRTPPCTDALISAGIARAVIAIKDPYEKVNGRGIEQLRSAGIDVEVGLCEDEALRLNEGYLKFVTRGIPFAHGVVEYAGDQPWTDSVWKPSSGFIKMACEYDAIVVGERHDLNNLLVSSRLRQARHRPLVVVGDKNRLASIESSEGDKDSDRIVPIELTAGTMMPRHNPALSEAPGGKSNVAQIRPVPVEQDFATVLETLGRKTVTSVLLLPGLFNPSAPNVFEQLDKLSLVVPGLKSQEGRSTHLAFEDLEFDLEEVTVVEVDRYTEFTGYPSLRGVA